MMELLADPQVWIAFATLTIMEIVLGIDNVVFISVIVSKLPPEQAKRARQIGLALALVFRILLLFALSWLIGLSQPVFSAFGQDVSWRDIILLVGGLFLIYKGTSEIHDAIEGESHEEAADRKKGSSFNFIIGQIIIIDIVFSVDSIITAIGMAQHIEVMVAAVMVAVAVMYAASGPVADFVHRHPTTKMLALSFLLLIGVSLVADGLGFHIPRGYIYFAMAFSALVEMFNIAMRTRRNKLRSSVSRSS
jgi:predicted tellurium resistance membrane protein TerC